MRQFRAHSGIYRIFQSGFHRTMLIICLLVISVAVPILHFSTMRQIGEASQQTIHILRKEVAALRRKLSNVAPSALVYDSDSEEELPMIYIITPTFTRPTQLADLTRLCYTLLLIPRVLWILVEDATKKSIVVKDFLQRCGVPYTHLSAETPKNVKDSVLKRKKPRGVDQRNEGLRWIRANTRGQGVVYFGDDDNTYDVELFEEMRFTENVSVWPVGLAGGLLAEGPLVDQENGKIRGFNAMYKKHRKFPLDMAAFAINVTLLRDHPEAKFSYSDREAELESMILQPIIQSAAQMEPKAAFGTKILVWHTRTAAASLNQEPKLKISSDSHISYVRNKPHR